MSDFADSYVEAFRAGQVPMSTPITWANADLRYVTRRGVATRVIYASQLQPRNTLGSGINVTELVTNRPNFDSYEFDPGTNEFAQVWVDLPGWDYQPIQVRFEWTAASGSGSVVWGAQGRVYLTGDLIDQALGSAQEVTDTLPGVNRIDVSPYTPLITLAGTPGPGYRILLQVYRNAASGSDNLGVDAQLKSIEIQYGTV